MLLYFLIDTSGSMDGAKISSVNDTMENIISELKLYSDNENININVLSFARKAKWMYKQACSIKEFKWNILTASGMTSLGNACKLLAKNIEKNANNEEIKILLISDGLPTDDFDEGLKKLNDSVDNKNTIRYAIALEGADIKTLTIFTENADNVFKLEDLDNLMEVILSTLNLDDFNQIRRNDSIDDDEWS